MIVHRREVSVLYRMVLEQHTREQSVYAVEGEYLVSSENVSPGAVLCFGDPTIIEQVITDAKEDFKLFLSCEVGINTHSSLTNDSENLTFEHRSFA